MDIYPIERILAIKKIKNQVHYLIKWRGYPFSEATFQPASTLTNNPLLNEFVEQCKIKPKKNLKYYQDRDVVEILGGSLTQNLFLWLKVRLRDDRIVRVSSEYVKNNNAVLLCQFYQKHLRIYD